MRLGLFVPKISELMSGSVQMFATFREKDAAGSILEELNTEAKFAAGDRYPVSKRGLAPCLPWQ